MQIIHPAEVLDTLDEYMLVDGFHTIIDFEKSNGNYIVDAVTGQEFLDCYGYFASMAIGHNHPKLIDPKLIKFYNKMSVLRGLKDVRDYDIGSDLLGTVEKIKDLDFRFIKDFTLAAIANPSNADIYSTQMAGSVKTMAEYMMTDDFKHFFFIAGGALAVENALKAAFDWKVRKNFTKGINSFAKYEHNDQDILGMQIMHSVNAFHGRSGYTLSLTNTDKTKIDYFPKFPWPRIMHLPCLKFGKDGCRNNLAEVKRLEKKALQQARQYIKKYRHDIAAAIFEPIQGEGGDNYFRSEYLMAWRRLCDDNDMLLIFDEVQTGIGLTGKMWAYQHLGVVPDIVVFGKKGQICGIMAGPRLDEVKDNVFRTSGRINSTFGGNLVDFMRGARYLEIIHEDKLIDNAATVGYYFLEQLYSKVYSKTQVQNIRGQGLMIAFDLKTSEMRDALRLKCWENRLAVLTCGKRSIRFRPSLIFTKDNVDEAISIIIRSLKKI